MMCQSNRDINKLPPELKDPYLDVILLYAEEDREKAQRYITHLKNVCGMKVALYDEIGRFINGKMQALQFSYSRSTYVFMFVTENFIKNEDGFQEFASHACILESLQDPNRRWCVIPVFIDPPERRTYEIPFCLKPLKGLNFYNRNFLYEQTIKSLIEKKLDYRRKKEKDLEQKRVEEWKRIEKEEEQKIEKMNQEKKELFLKTKEKENEITNKMDMENRNPTPGYSQLPNKFSALHINAQTCSPINNFSRFAHNPSYTHCATFNAWNPNPFSPLYNAQRQDRFSHNSDETNILNERLDKRSDINKLQPPVTSEQHVHVEYHHHHYHQVQQKNEQKTVNIIGAKDVHIGDGHHFNTSGDAVCIDDLEEMTVDSEDACMDSDRSSDNSEAITPESRSSRENDETRMKESCLSDID